MTVTFWRLTKEVSKGDRCASLHIHFSSVGQDFQNICENPSDWDRKDDMAVSEGKRKSGNQMLDPNVLMRCNTCGE